jgi:hypothetical protein
MQEALLFEMTFCGARFAHPANLDLWDFEVEIRAD